MPRWNHVEGKENPADCASTGILPSKLVRHQLWWNGPCWLLKESSEWPKGQFLPAVDSDAEKIPCHLTTSYDIRLVISFKQYSSVTKLLSVVAWVFRFLDACRRRRLAENNSQSRPLQLLREELSKVENYLILIVLSQMEYFGSEIKLLTSVCVVSCSSSLKSLDPFVDPVGILRVGGRMRRLAGRYDQIHPIVLHGNRPLTWLMIRSEHLRLLHGGLTLTTAALSRRFHIIGGRKTVRSIIRSCIHCRRVAGKTVTQKMGDLPPERITPDCVFANVGVDYAGPFMVKYGYIRKPTLVKAYVCVFVSLSVKATHLEIVANLTSEAFIACLWRFVSRRGRPHLIMSENGTNFVGANNELKELSNFSNNKLPNRGYRSFVSMRVLSGSSYPSVHLTSEVSGRLQ